MSSEIAKELTRLIQSIDKLIDDLVKDGYIIKKNLEKLRKKPDEPEAKEEG